MMLTLLLLPAAMMFALSFFRRTQLRHILSFVYLLTLIPVVMLMTVPKPYHLWSDYLVADTLGAYILLLASIVGIGVTLSLLTLDKRVDVEEAAYRRFYRFFAILWLGLVLSLLSNNMGIYWIGLELATLSTVYMIKTNHTKGANREAWNYMIIGAIAISLILFGIILIYAGAKPILGEEAMHFNALQSYAKEIKNPFLFEMGFAFVTVGMFVKMSFFPMSLWMGHIERAAFYPVAALFSGILESAIIIGFFRFSKIAMEVNYPHLFGFVFVYGLLTLFIVAFLIYRAKDFIRIFSLSGIEHMVLIVLFWVSGGTFAALLHFGAHAFLKPALFLSTGVLESHGKYRIAGALRGYRGTKGALFRLLIGLFLVAIIALPPSPMFFSEIYGFGSMMDFAKKSDYMLAMIFAIVLILLLLSVIFYRFVAIYQSMKYGGVEEEKTVYTSELLSLAIFTVSLIVLLMPVSLDYLRSIG